MQRLVGRGGDPTRIGEGQARVLCEHREQILLERRVGAGLVRRDREAADDRALIVDGRGHRPLQLVLAKRGDHVAFGGVVVNGDDAVLVDRAASGSLSGR